MQESSSFSSTKGHRQLRKSVRLSTKVTASSKKLKIKFERLSPSDAGGLVSTKARSKFTDRTDRTVPSQPSAEDSVSLKRRKKGTRSRSSSVKKKRSKHYTEDEEENLSMSDEREEDRVYRAGGKNMSEERRALHRVHERQRHQSLNDAIQELVKVLPPGDVCRNVTKFNVLRKANDYIDFLQYKINNLCLDGSIEQKTEDCRFRFNVPLMATFDGKELKIPASTPISPKLLRGIKKSAQIVSTNQQAEKLAVKPNRVRTPQTLTPRYSGLRSKKSPHKKLNTGNSQNTHTGGYFKEVHPHTDPGCYSKIPKMVSCTDRGGHSKEAFPDPHMDPGAYSKRVPNTDLGGHAEGVPHTTPRGNSCEVPKTNPRDYPREVPHTDPDGYSEEDSHMDSGGNSREVPCTISEPATPQKEDMFESDQGELVVDEGQLSPRESVSAEIDNPCTFELKPKEPSKSFPIVSRKSSQRRKMKKLWQGKGASLAPSTPLDREQRKKLLDYYISTDSSPDSVYSLPAATSKPAEASASANSLLSESDADFDVETPFQIPCKNHMEHSYFTKSHQSYLTDIHNKARLPSEHSSVEDFSSQPMKFSQVDPSETSTSQVKTAMGPGKLDTNDCHASFCQIGQENPSNHMHKSSTNSTEMPTWKTEETNLSKNSNLDCSDEMQTIRAITQPMTATSVPLLYSTVTDSTTSVCNPLAKSTSLMGMASNDTASTAPCCFLTSSASLVCHPAEASSLPSSNIPTLPTAEIVPNSTTIPMTLGNKLATACATLPTQTIKTYKASENKLLHYSIILPTSIVSPSTVPTLPPTLTKQPILSKTTVPLQSYTLMPSTFAQHGKAATTPRTPSVTSCETAPLRYSTVYPAAPLHQSTKPANLPIRNLWTTPTSKSHHYVTLMPTTRMQKNRSAANLPAATYRKTVAPEQHSAMPTAQAPYCAVASSTPNENSTLLSSGKTVSLYYSTILPNTGIYYTTATSETVTTQHMRATTTSRTTPRLFSSTLCRSTAASTLPVQTMLMTSTQNTSHRYPTVVTTSMTQYNSEKFTFMPSTCRQAAPTSTLPGQHIGTSSANKTTSYYHGAPVPSTQVTTVTMATATATLTDNTFMTVVPETFAHHHSDILPNTILHGAPTTQPTETAQTTSACEKAHNYVTTATSSQSTAAPTLTTSDQNKSKPQRYVPIQPSTTGSNDTATSSQSTAAPTLTTSDQNKSNPQHYVPIQPSTTGSNNTASSQSSAAPTLTTSDKSKPQRYVLIQPSTIGSNDTAPAAPPFQQVAIYGASSDMMLQNNLATISTAQMLVVDPSFLQFEESERPLGIPLGSESPVLTSTAASSCSLRRSWINGYQLFTKVNHPNFRDKWPQLQGREITKLLSQVWKELPGDSKKRYSRRAREWNQWHRKKREPSNKPGKEE